MVGMSDMGERMPRVMAFPGALGTGLIVRMGDAADTSPLRTHIGAFISEYERVLSRFRADSTVTAMGEAAHGGRFEFPQWTAGLFDLYDALVDATDGAIDPCVGEDLIRLGYDARYSFTMDDDASDRLGAVHGRPTWRGDVTRAGRHGTTLVTRRAVHLDFGACGKGYLVDCIGRMIDGEPLAGPGPRDETDDAVSAALPHGDGDAVTLASKETEGTEFLIDAGGDLLIHSSQPITIGLEDPADTSRAVGTANVTRGSFCASAPSRRHWQTAGHLELHHLLNAIDGRPVRDVAATWVAVRDDGRDGSGKISPLGCRLGRNDRQWYPTALADGLATALFVVSPDNLTARFPFECTILRPNRTASISRHFPGQLFTA